VDTIKEGRGLCECQSSQVVIKIIRSALSADRHWKWLSVLGVTVNLWIHGREYSAQHSLIVSP
jgi:hypothetical protein